MTRRTALLWITLSLAGGLLPARAAADVAELHRPILAVWSAQVGPEGTSWCRHCDRFWQDFRENDSFREALCSRYRVVYINADRRRLEGTLLQGITALPTFTAPGRRIVGYTSPADLLARLGIAVSQAEQPPASQPQPELPQTPPSPPATLPQPDLPDETPPAEPLPEETRADESLRTDPQPDLPTPENREFNAPATPPAPAKSVPNPAPPAATTSPAPEADSNDSNDSTSRTSTDSDRTTPPDTTGTNSTHPAETPAELSNRKPVELPAVITWLARPVALYFGGPLAAAAVGAAGWWWGRRQQRHSARQHDHTRYHPPPAQPAQQSNAQQSNEDHTIPGNREPRTETRYVRVPVADQEGEAWREAVRRMAELHPGAVPLLNTLESTASQLLHGRKVTAGSSQVPAAKPGLWTDPPP